jgi:hypothetical protein
MRVLTTLLGILAVLLAQPAAAQRIVVPSAPGGSPTNVNTTYETVGVFLSGPDAGEGTTVTGGAANTKGAAWEQLTAATTSDWAGFMVLVSAANSSGNRFLVDIATGALAAETVIIPNFFAFPSSVGAGMSWAYFPLNVPAGTRISAKLQANGSGGNAQVSIVGEVRTANHPPLWNNCELLAAAWTTTTYPSATTITSVSAGNTGWTEVVASTARTYGAMVANMGPATGLNPTVARSLIYRLATGAAASEVAFYALPSGTIASNPYTGRPPLRPIFKSIPSGTRVSAEVISQTTEAAFSPQVYGCY